MGGDEKDGYYCSICGGIPPDKITTKRMLIDGKETGIDHLDWICEEVEKLNITDDMLITDELHEKGKTIQLRSDKKEQRVRCGVACRI